MQHSGISTSQTGTLVLNFHKKSGVYLPVLEYKEKLIEDWI